MIHEGEFIRAILDDPNAVGPRLIYADWLEERGDAVSLRRAEFLRVECELDALTPKDSKRRRLRNRLTELMAEVGVEWWQQLDWADVAYCVKFKFRCPKSWDTLQPTDNPSVRHCSECNQDVFYCRTSHEAHQRAEAGECVAIDSRSPRLPLRLVREGQRQIRMGRIAPRAPKRRPLSQRGQGATNE